MHNKLIAVLIGLTLLLGGGLAGAVEKQFKKISNKSSMSSVKCWKRTWVTSEALMGRSTMPVCKAFEEVLNTACEPPEQLRCNWTLPPEEKRFEKLKWESIDPINYWGLIEDIVLAGWSKKYRIGQWARIEPEYKKALSEGYLELKTAPIDIDHDDQLEKTVFFRKGLCGKVGWKDLFGVMDPKTKRFDWRFEHVVSDVNATYGAEIMIYNSKAYMFGWDDTWKVLMVYEGFYLTANDKGNQNICQFNYIKRSKP